MKHLYSFCFFIFIFCLTAMAQDTLWIRQHTVIEMDDSLIIPKNTVVFFTGSYQLAVIGTLKAQGTAEQPIIFTSAYDSLNPSTTSWQGIEFSYTDDNPISDSSIFEHCVFQYAHAYTGCGSTSGFGGAVRTYGSSRIRFSDCRFENNFAQIYGGAAYLEASDIVFDNCIFNNNKTDSAGTTSGGCMAIINAAPSLLHCTIANSWSSSVGGGIIAMNCDSAKIMNCAFYGNSGTTGGGMFISGCSFMLFSGNVFYNNDGRYFGGGIALKNANFRIINCTVADNFGGQGGGIYCSSGVECNAYNSIFCHNEIWEFAHGPQIYIAYQESTINFFNCLVVNGYNDFGGNGGGVDFHGVWSDVIEEEIAFSSCDMEYEYCLPEHSPCINSGSMKITSELLEVDILGNQRITEGTIDMGAFESNYYTIIQEDNAHVLTIFPNPATSKIIVSINNESLKGTPWTLADMNGKIISSKNITESKFEISVQHLKSGIYLLFGDGWKQKIAVTQ